MNTDSHRYICRSLSAICYLLSTVCCLSAQPVSVQTERNTATVTRGPLTLVFDPSGNGCVSSATLGDKQVALANSDSGLFASIIPSDSGRPLQPTGAAEVSGKVTVKTVAADKTSQTVTIMGTVSFPAGGAPFVVTITVPHDGPAALSAELELPQSLRKTRLASFGLAVPLNLNFHPAPGPKVKFDKTCAAAILPRFGPTVPEIRRLAAEQDHSSVWGTILWTLAGIRQSAPTSFQVWEAWNAQTPPFILQQHNMHPGWMAVADTSFAVAAAMPGIDRIAPKEIYVDGQAKVLRICFQSSYCRPLDLASAPANLSAGPAYLYIEPSTPATIEPAGWRDPQKLCPLAHRPTDSKASADSVQLRRCAAGAPTGGRAGATDRTNRQ